MDLLHNIEQGLLAANTTQDFINANQFAATFLQFHRFNEKECKEIEVVYGAYIHHLASHENNSQSRKHKVEMLMNAIEAMRHENPRFSLVATAGIAEAIIDLRKTAQEVSREIAGTVQHNLCAPEPAVP